LPVLTTEDKRHYRRFRKLLIQNGFIMLQESVYCKLLTTPTVENSVKRLLRENRPPKGIVQVLTITEKQFSKMEFVVGEHKSDVISSNQGLVIL
ncbi:MAG: CRISPR-associated endonuclease Cas2, partial [Coriobacteriia bacterium]|nr:CRISPR-associated endonuclease Cas2 [Coriobacteriia bacterium]